MGTTSRTARAWRRDVGSPPTARATQGSILSISATTSTPASRSAKRCRRRAGISCSSARSHPTIEEYSTGVELSELTKQVKHGRQRFTHSYRWLCDVPLRDGADAMTVNWLMIEIRNAAGEMTYRNSFITDLPTDRDTVVELSACGRARWKIENESFN